jgi:peptidoglycan L-alanyl-D-glutamate endopeptidase CwlK
MIRWILGLMSVSLTRKMNSLTRVKRTWGHRSAHVYRHLCPELQILVTRLRDEVMDISLLSGHRDAEEQNALFEVGASTLRWPDSKHNKLPSVAVDIQPHPCPEYEPKLWGALGYLAGRAYAIAKEEGFHIRWGGDWDGDGDVTDQNFDDLFHIEVTKIETTNSSMDSSST